MALSTPVQEKLEKSTGLDLIWESRSLYAEILFCFRECHDICVHSKLFSDETILAVDQCGARGPQLRIFVDVIRNLFESWLDS